MIFVCNIWYVVNVCVVQSRWERGDLFHVSMRHIIIALFMFFNIYEFNYLQISLYLSRVHDESGYNNVSLILISVPIWEYDCGPVRTYYHSITFRDGQTLSLTLCERVWKYLTSLSLVLVIQLSTTHNSHPSDRHHSNLYNAESKKPCKIYKHIQIYGLNCAAILLKVK
jgi:hypothetical protein